MDWYVVVVIPSREVNDFVDKYRKKYAKYTEYVIPPHITIYPPFLITNSNEDKVVKVLQDSFTGILPIEVKCKSVNYFEGSRNNAAYFELDKDAVFKMRDLLVRATKALEGKIKNVFDDDNYTPPKYVPHMTIAERIPKGALPDIKKELANFAGELTFKVSAVFLYKQENGSKIWGELAEIKF